MIISSFLLAISTSIDSLGIGLTYGFKKTKLPFSSKKILLGISFIVSFLSVFIGNSLTNFYYSSLSNIISSSILILIGSIILLKNLHPKDSSLDTYYDFNNSKTIEPTEAFVLALALSLDSFGVGIGYGLLNCNSFLFPILVVIFQYIFLSLGMYLGTNITKLRVIPDNFWGIISGILILIIGISKLLI